MQNYDKLELNISKKTMNKLHIISKTLPLLLMMLFYKTSLRASECYHYHTLKTYQLKNTDGKLYLEMIVKDPNKISIASYDKVLLKGVMPNNAIVFSETEDGIIIKNNFWYYYVAKNSLLDEPVLIDHIVDVKTQTLSPIGFSFLLDDTWKKLDYNPYYPTRAERVKFVPVKNMPKSATVMASYIYGKNSIYLLKDKNKVYRYDEATAEVIVIENINPNTAKVDTLNQSSDEYCIYDDNTFYMTRDNFRTVEDMIPQFKSMGLKQSFLKLKFHRPNSIRTYLDFQDGALWPYVSAGISLDQGGDVNFYKVENCKYFEASGLVLHNGFLYEDPWDLVYENHPIDLPKFPNIKDFKLTTDGLYSVGKDIYKVRDLDGGSILDKVENAVSFENDAVATFNNSLWSYRHSTSQFFLSKDAVNFYNYNTQNIERTINHQSQLKDLKLAFAFDDKLLIEDKVIPSIADYGSIEFLGSTVDVKQGCDGGRGQIEIVVEYNYFFKDKNAVYKYHTGDKGLKIMKDKDALSCKQDNFIDTFWYKN